MSNQPKPKYVLPEILSEVLRGVPRDVLPPEVVERLHQFAHECRSPEEFVSKVTVGRCPRCRSESTVDGDEVPEVDDPCIGVCLKCGYRWCLECDQPIVEEACGHWDICKACDEPSDEHGGCPRVVEGCKKLKL